MAISGVQAIDGSPFNVGDEVNVRCRVTVRSGQGSGARVTLVVDTPGNIGEAAGVTFVVSPTQCRRAQGVTNSSAQGVSNPTF